EELCGPNGLGFTYVSVGDSVSRPIVDKLGTVIGCIAPPPSEDWTDQINEQAIAALERERSGKEEEAMKTKKNKRSKKKFGLLFKPEEEVHRRGHYLVKADRLSGGGGQATIKRIYHSNRNEAGLNRLRHEQCFIRVAGHMSAVFAYWSLGLSTDTSADYLYPDLQVFDFQKFKPVSGHFSQPDTVEKLRGNDPSLVFNFPNSIFACATYNFGPETITMTHLDYLNYIAGWCGITNFGRFDYRKGGHFVLWDLKLVLEFPPGWTILIPSAYLRHSNTAIGPNETRYSFTQYTVGAIFRYVED
ncbi:hypothetical protein K435DRAFT_880363, partial [Dendrothele bispora CBS 962.96]